MATKWIWHKIISEALGEGLSAYQALKRARSLGYKIRTQTFYEYWREAIKPVNIGKSFWYRIIDDALGSGYSAYRALQEARRLGLKIRTQTFYQMWNEVKQQKALPELLAKYDPEKPLPWYLHPKTPINYPTKYGYVVKAIDEFMNLEMEFGIYTNRTKSIAEIIDEAIDMADSYYGLAPTKITITKAWRK